MLKELGFKLKKKNDFEAEEDRPGSYSKRVPFRVGRKNLAKTDLKSTI